MKIILRVLAFLILILIFLVAGYALFRKNHFIPKEEAIETYQFPNSEFVEWEGINVHMLEHGSPKNQSVILIHGLGGALHEFNPLAERLAESYHVVSFDLPGFGLSDAPTHSDDIQQVYADFMDFILNNYASDTCFVVGNSMGGMIAWNTALLHPKQVQKLVLLAPAGYDMIEIAEKNAEWINQPSIQFLLARGAAPFIAKTNVEMCFHNDELVDSMLIERKYGMMNKEGNLDYLRQLAGYKDFMDTIAIQQIQTPTLLIWGTEDEIIPYSHAERFHRDLPNNTLLTYEDCGHAPMLEELDKCAADILLFLK
ncbi:MAG: pimeloyl-ACP methyl ester carboxylesterase [Chitinophagales bacterium]|jgi:pimeloyl-ACP methyl ester carboxylesterase